jgi:hypothetical protein
MQRCRAIFYAPYARVVIVRQGSDTRYLRTRDLSISDCIIRLGRLVIKSLKDRTLLANSHIATRF